MTIVYLAHLTKSMALKDLSSTYDIVIKEAEIPGDITIINDKVHIKMCDRQLKDNSTYHESSTDVIKTHIK